MLLPVLNDYLIKAKKRESVIKSGENLLKDKKGKENSDSLKKVFLNFYQRKFKKGKWRYRN